MNTLYIYNLAIRYTDGSETRLEVCHKSAAQAIATVLRRKYMGTSLRSFGIDSVRVIETRVVPTEL